MKIGSIAALLSALSLCLFLFLENRQSLQSQQTQVRSAQSPPREAGQLAPGTTYGPYQAVAEMQTLAATSRPPVPTVQIPPPEPTPKPKPSGKAAATALGPMGFPYPALTPLPVESIPPFTDKDFKIGVVARISEADAAKNCALMAMGQDRRTVQLDKDFRLFRISSAEICELNPKELFASKRNELCQITLEVRGGREKVTQIYTLGDDIGPKNSSEIHKKEQELWRFIVDWKNAFGGRWQLTPAQLKQGADVIRECERLLLLLGVDTYGKGFAFHTRGSFKKASPNKQIVTLALGEHERSWKVSKEAKVIVVTVTLTAGQTWKLAPDGMGRLRNDSQVYLTFDNEDSVTRIDILERETLPPLVLPDLPWLPYPMIDMESRKDADNQFLGFGLGCFFH